MGFAFRPTGPMERQQYAFPADCFHAALQVLTALFDMSVLLHDSADAVPGAIALVRPRCMF